LLSYHKYLGKTSDLRQAAFAGNLNAIKDICLRLKGGKDIPVNATSYISQINKIGRFPSKSGAKNEGDWDVRTAADLATDNGFIDCAMFLVQEGCLVSDANASILGIPPNRMEIKNPIPSKPPRLIAINSSSTMNLNSNPNSLQMKLLALQMSRRASVIDSSQTSPDIQGLQSSPAKCLKLTSTANNQQGGQLSCYQLNENIIAPAALWKNNDAMNSSLDFRSKSTKVMDFSNSDIENDANPDGNSSPMPGSHDHVDGIKFSSASFGFSSNVPGAKETNTRNIPPILIKSLPNVSAPSSHRFAFPGNVFDDQVHDLSQRTPHASSYKGLVKPKDYSRFLPHKEPIAYAFPLAMRRIKPGDEPDYQLPTVPPMKTKVRFL
jgi:hypothetical protein